TDRLGRSCREVGEVPVVHEIGGMVAVARHVSILGPPRSAVNRCRGACIRGPIGASVACPDTGRALRYAWLVRSPGEEGIHETMQDLQTAVARPCVAAAGARPAVRRA